LVSEIVKVSAVAPVTVRVTVCPVGAPLLLRV
jgi:hypothetical protein